MTSFLVRIVFLLVFCSLPHFGFGQSNSFPFSTKTIIAQVEKVTNLIHQRYEFDNEHWRQFFYMILNMPPNAWEQAKYQFAMKIMQSAINTASVNANTNQYKMVFLGSSVTAGYDNFYEQSYPQVIERHLKPILQSLGIKLVVNNIGQFRVNCRASNYCLRSAVGNDFDFLIWENTYSCGRDEAAVEYIVRSALQSNAIFFIEASGSYAPQDCDKSPDPLPWTAENWTPELANITKKYTITKDSISRFKENQFKWYEDSNAVGKFSKLLDVQYKEAGLHGFNMWSKSKSLCQTYTNETTKESKAMKLASKTFSSNNNNNKHSNNKNNNNNNKLDKDLLDKLDLSTTKVHESSRSQSSSSAAAAATATPTRGCDTIKLLKHWCHQSPNQGPHWMVRESATRGDNPQQLIGRSWNPSRAMHLLRGEVFLYTYLHILVDAIYQIEEDLRTELQPQQQQQQQQQPSSLTVYQRLFDRYRSEYQKLRPSVPVSPTFCKSYECTTTFEAHCFTDYAPMPNEVKMTTKAESHQLKNHVLNGYSKRYEHDWRVELLNTGVNMHTYGYKDYKNYYKATGPNKQLFIALPEVKSGYIYIFGIGGNQALRDVLFLIETSAHDVHDTIKKKQRNHWLSRLFSPFRTSPPTVGQDVHEKEYLPSKRREQLKDVVYDASSDLMKISNVPTGEGHVLTILTPPNVSDDYKTSVSHIVVF